MEATAERETFDFSKPSELQLSERMRSRYWQIKNAFHSGEKTCPTVT